MKTELDATDWRILRELQANGRMTNVELANRVGISAPPCLRRLRALEDSGFIIGYRALLDGAKIGFPITAFAMVSLNTQAEADLQRFVAKVDSWAIVRECYMVSGEYDFALKCVAPDVTAFQNFVIDELTKIDGIDTVRTFLTHRQTKDAPLAPLDSMSQ